ncbi:MAG: hypothetical protein AAGI23_09435 [Bacteroidota bacterium]
MSNNLIIGIAIGYFACKLLEKPSSVNGMYLRPSNLKEIEPGLPLSVRWGKALAQTTYQSKMVV